MRRLSALALVLAIAGDAAATKGKHDPPARARPAPTAAAPAPAPDPRAALGNQLAAESATLDRALATVDEKLAAADALRLRHVRAATRALHAPLAEGASPDDRLTLARRRAAVRLLLDRDAAERDLLAREADRLRAAGTRVGADTTALTALAPPGELAWPVRGKVSRAFGTFEHERSHAQLSRRGIDIEVDEHAPAAAPADGVVRYVGSIRGLDAGVVIDHGSYWTVIAKLADPPLIAGAHVTRGDRIGHAAHHRVYFELRAKLGPGGLPVDPEPYLPR